MPHTPRRAAMRSALLGGALAALVLVPPLAHATVPGKNGRIAFADVTYDGRLFTMAPQGTDIFELRVRTGAFHSSPSWSPDGRRIAYASTADGLPQSGPLQIFTANPDGSDARRLTDLSWAGHPTWSPDGRRIAFHVSPNSSQTSVFGEIWVMNADGTGQTRISAPGARDFHPSWSPGGFRIAFSSDRSFANGGPGSREIYNMAVDGSDVRRVTIDRDTDDHPSFAPTGNRLVWTSDVETITRSTIWEADALTGRNAVRRTSGPGDRDPVVSPDGNWIAFASNCRSDPTCRTSINIWRVRRDGTDPRPLGGSWQGHSPDWQRLP